MDCRQNVMVIKSVLFDFGGTLVIPVCDWSEVTLQAVTLTHAYARERGILLSLEEFAKRNASFFLEYEELERKRGADIPDSEKYRQFVQELFPGLTAKQKVRIAANMNQIFWQKAYRNWTLRDGANECLQDLRSMNISMAIVSNHNNHRALLSILNELNIRDYFKTIIVSEKIGVRKPNREIFLRCLSKMKVSAKQAVFVGDSMENDIIGANVIGMKTIWIQESMNSKPPADFVVSELRQIPDIIAELNMG
jgi:HAD superfamily hydrolase (TIGR01662 family)